MKLILNDLPNGRFKYTMTITAKMSRRLKVRLFVGQHLINLGVWLLKGTTEVIDEYKIGN